MEINLSNFKIDLSQSIEVEQLRYVESKLRLKERQLSKQIRELQELQTKVINKRQKLTALRDAKEKEVFERAGRIQFLRARKSTETGKTATPRMTKWERAIQLIAEGKVEEAKALVGK